MEINICFISDNNYAIFTGIALTSLKKVIDAHNHYHIHILSNNISIENKNKIKILDADNFVIEFIDVNEYEKYNDMHISNISANATSLYKFRIPEMLNKIDKVLYFDGDVIFRKNIDELYNTNVSKYYAVVTPENDISVDEIPFSCKRLNLNHKVYFNSGLMLLNLDMLRKDNICDKLLDYRINGKNFLMDQDAYNYIIGANVLLYTPWSFTPYYDLFDKRQFHKYNEKNKYAIFKKTIVLHLAAKKKPWVCSDPQKLDQL